MEKLLSSPFYIEHGNRLLESYKLLTGNDLLPPPLDDNESGMSVIERLQNAPFVVLSHGIEDEPIFNFANNKALALFEISWDEVIKMPSRLSAETINQTEREYLLNTVSRQGYIDNYSGVRISAKGRRFMINKAVVWNIIDAKSNYYGQAAMFSQWDFL